MLIKVNIRESKYAPGKYGAYVSFKYNEAIIDEIRSYRHRAWHADTKEWEISLQELSDLIYEFYECEFHITGRYVDMTPKVAIVPDGFEFKTKPYRHQIEGFNFGLTHDRWLLADEQGLGKTKQIIDIAIAKKLERGYKHCLIICGVNGLKWNWMNEIKTHSNETGYILGQKVQKRTNKLIIGSSTDKTKDLARLESLQNYFIITNIESLRNADIFAEMKHQLELGNINMIAMDEAHRIKDPSSQQGKAFLKLQADYMVAMTGTPVMNSPFDLYASLRWLGYEKHSFYSFTHYYGEYGGYGGYQVIRYRNLNELEDMVADVMLRRLKEEVLDLPEKTYIDEYVDMLPKQKQIYNEIKAEIMSNLDLISLAPNPLAEMIRLRQATGYTGILSSEIQCSAKLDRMEELVEDTVTNGKKLLIFSNWTSITDAAYDRLFPKQYGLMRITGDTPDNVRQDIINTFQSDDRCRVLIGTIGALGTGVTLTEASVIILLDEPWNKATREQAIDRAHRIGQNNKLTIYTLMCKDTIDERVHEIVEKKGAISDLLIDDKMPEDKEELVKFLLS